jgi:hypothetical protein
VLHFQKFSVMAVRTSLPEVYSYGGPKILSEDGGGCCKPVSSEGTSDARPYGDPLHGAHSFFAELGDELRQDEEALLHTLPREYQTFLRMRLSLNSGKLK